MLSTNFCSSWSALSPSDHNRMMSKHQNTISTNFSWFSAHTQKKTTQFSPSYSFRRAERNFLIFCPLLSQQNYTSWSEIWKWSLRFPPALEFHSRFLVCLICLLAAAMESVTRWRQSLSGREASCLRYDECVLRLISLGVGFGEIAIYCRNIWNGKQKWKLQFSNLLATPSSSIKLPFIIFRLLSWCCLRDDTTLHEAAATLSNCCCHSSNRFLTPFIQSPVLFSRLIMRISRLIFVCIYDYRFQSQSWWLYSSARESKGDIFFKLVYLPPHSRVSSSWH